VGQDTVWVVVSDHGELLGEHGLWGHNLGLWEPLVSVPMVVAGPGWPEGVVVDDPVSLVDVLPTVAALAGADLPEPVAGIDLGPVVRGERSLADRTLIAEHLRTDFLTSGWQLLDPLADHASIRARRAAARRGDLKRILAEDGTDQGFDLSVDPDELTPLPGGELPLAVRLPTPAAGAPVPSLDQATTDALQALGYLR
jgi:arylsulfatase A-like enzyme